jgi:hypothetical protein
MCLSVNGFLCYVRACHKVIASHRCFQSGLHTRMKFLNYDVRIQNLGRSKGQGLEWGSGSYLLEPSRSHRGQVPLVDIPSVALAVRWPREARLGGHGATRCRWRQGIGRHCPARGWDEATDSDLIRARREAPQHTEEGRRRTVPWHSEEGRRWVVPRHIEEGWRRRLGGGGRRAGGGRKRRAVPEDRMNWGMWVWRGRTGQSEGSWCECRGRERHLGPHIGAGWRAITTHQVMIL